MKRGEIYYIDERPITGSEQQAGRPGIIVSNDKCNASSDVVEVVFTTAQPKKWLPTHVSISATPRPSTALCEQPAPVAITRIGNYIGQVTPAEQANIDTALLIHFDLYIPPQEAPQTGGGHYTTGKPRRGTHHRAAACGARYFPGALRGLAGPVPPGQVRG